MGNHRPLRSSVGKDGRFRLNVHLLLLAFRSPQTTDYRGRAVDTKKLLSIGGDCSNARGGSVAGVSTTSAWRTIKRAITVALSNTAGKPKATARPGIAPAAEHYPGDFTGSFEISYQPRSDATADPGEVVWTWVPYEEDHQRGKDRPVLIVGHDDGWLLAVAMTSKDHDADAAQEASQGRFWVDIGTGDWDRSGRASEVRVDRIVRVDPRRVRRIAAHLDKSRFAEVAKEIVQHHR